MPRESTSRCSPYCPPERFGGRAEKVRKPTTRPVLIPPRAQVRNRDQVIAKLSVDTGTNPLWSCPCRHRPSLLGGAHRTIRRNRQQGPFDLPMKSGSRSAYSNCCRRTVAGSRPARPNPPRTTAPGRDQRYVDEAGTCTPKWAAGPLRGVAEAHTEGRAQMPSRRPCQTLSAITEKRSVDPLREAAPELPVGLPGSALPRAVAPVTYPVLANPPRVCQPAARRLPYLPPQPISAATWPTTRRMPGAHLGEALEWVWQPRSQWTRKTS